MLEYLDVIAPFLICFFLVGSAMKNRSTTTSAPEETDTQPGRGKQNSSSPGFILFIAFLAFVAGVFQLMKLLT